MGRIAGIVNLDGAPPQKELLRRMTVAALRPEAGEVGLELSDAVGFGRVFRTAARPWGTAGLGDLRIVADARLDNRVELERELESELPVSAGGGPRGDDELILAGYRRWGSCLCERLLGDFAFAIWDRCRRRLFCARDRLGTRPFYFARTAVRRFLFASSCRSLLAHPELEVCLDETTAAAHMLPWLARPQATYFEGISRLRPAHWLALDDRGLRFGRYWDVDPEREIRYRADREYEEHFIELFRRVMADRLASSGRLAILLSGGIDSGAVAAVAGALLRQDSLDVAPEPPVTLSWAFDLLSECDERRFSDQVAAAAGLASRSISADAHWLLSDAGGPEPVSDDPSPMLSPPLLRASLRYARAHGLAAVISGAGANAVTGGDFSVYPDLARGWRWGSLVRQLVRHRRQTAITWPRLLARYFVRPLWRSPGSGAAMPAASLAWIDPRFAARIGLVDLAASPPPVRPFREGAVRRRYGAVTNEYEERLLVAEAQLHAEEGVEQVLPWRDSRLIEFLLAIPGEQLWRAGRPKDLVRRALRGLVPEVVRHRGRGGSIAPLRTLGLRRQGRWLVERCLDRPLLGRLGFVDPAALRIAYRGYVRGEFAEYPLAQTLELEIWVRRTLEPGEWFNLTRSLGASGGRDSARMGSE